MGRPFLPQASRLVLLIFLLAQTACSLAQTGVSSTPSPPVATVAPVVEEGLLGRVAQLKHAIVPAQEPVSLSQATEFSYECQVRAVKPFLPHVITILSHAPLSGTEVLSESDVYLLTFVPEYLIVKRIKGSRPMSQAKFSYSLDGTTFTEPQPQHTSNDLLVLDCGWRIGETLDLKLRLDGMTLKNTDGLRFSFDDATVSSEAVPMLKYQQPRDLDSSLKSLETHLVDFWNMVLADLPAYQAGTDVAYMYSLTPLPSEQPMFQTMPVLHCPLVSLDQASRSATANVLAQRMREWYQTAQPSATNAKFTFSLRLYRLKDGQQVPIFDLANVCLPREAISGL